MKEYKAVKAEGVAVVIIHKKRILLVKRRNIPFIFNPGIWGFVTGSKKKSERYAETAYREVEEETGIAREQLKQIKKPVKVWMFDSKKHKKWQNYLFFFMSETSDVKLNIENSAFRWSSLSDIAKENNYTNIFMDNDVVIKGIGSCTK